MNPNQVLAGVRSTTELDLQKLGVGTQGMMALRGGYGGMLMFGMLGRMAGLAMLNPATIVLGVFMGRQAMKSEKERALNQRRSQCPPGPPQVHRRGDASSSGRTPATRCAASSASCATPSPPAPRSCTARPARR